MGSLQKPGLQRSTASAPVHFGAKWIGGSWLALRPRWVHRGFSLSGLIALKLLSRSTQQAKRQAFDLKEVSGNGPAPTLIAKQSAKPPPSVCRPRCHAPAAVKCNQARGPDPNSTQSCAKAARRHPKLAERLRAGSILEATSRASSNLRSPCLKYPFRCNSRSSASQVPPAIASASRKAARRGSVSGIFG